MKKLIIKIIGVVASLVALVSPVILYLIFGEEVLIVGIIFYLSIIFVIFYIFYSEIPIFFERRRILRFGTLAEATILKVDALDKDFDIDMALYFKIKITLEVRIRGRHSYEIKSELWVTHRGFYKYKVGTVVEVKVDPENQEKVKIIKL